MTNYYKELGLSRDMSCGEMQIALDEQMHLWSDRQAVDDPMVAKQAEGKLRLLESAYSILCNPEKRKQYDAQLDSGAVQVQLDEMPTDSNLQLMRRMYMEERYTDVLIIGEKMLAGNALGSAAMRYMALSYLSLGNPQEAMCLLDEAHEENPNDIELLYMCAEISVHHTENYSRALEYIEQLQLIDPHRMDVQALRIECLLMGGNLQQADTEVAEYMAYNSANRHFQALIAGAYEHYAMTLRNLTEDGRLLFDSEQQMQAYGVYVNKAYKLCNNKHYLNLVTRFEDEQKKALDMANWGILGASLSLTAFFAFGSHFAPDMKTGVVILAVLTVLLFLADITPRWKIRMYAFEKMKRTGANAVLHVLTQLIGRPIWFATKMIFWPVTLVVRRVKESL